MKLPTLDLIVINAARDTMGMVIPAQVVVTKRHHHLVELQQPMIVHTFLQMILIVLKCNN